LLVEQNARAALQTAQYAYVLEIGRWLLKVRRNSSSMMPKSMRPI
jgi:ABC-type branched-subunit amino acid transport system ATPase component